MRPTLRQLQYLVAIADTGRYGEAAKQVHISQPSLSAQIANMEAELGTTLIERGRHGALLTPQGKEVVRRARMILRDVIDLKSAARLAPDFLTGELRFGVLSSVGPYLLPPAARRLHASYPDFRFTIREERPMELVEHLHEGLFDAVISTTDEHLNYKSEPVFDDQLWVCMAADDVLAQTRGPLALTDLAGRALLSLGYWHWHDLDRRVQAIAEASGAYVSAEYEGTTLDAVRHMAEMGAGLAILPSIYALIEVRRAPKMFIRRIDDTMATRQISLIWRDTSPLDASFNVLAGILRDVATDILQNKERAA